MAVFGGLCPPLLAGDGQHYIYPTPKENNPAAELLYKLIKSVSKLGYSNKL